jgi:hypothetical protein
LMATVSSPFFSKFDATRICFKKRVSCSTCVRVYVVKFKNTKMNFFETLWPVPKILAICFHDLGGI